MISRWLPQWADLLEDTDLIEKPAAALRLELGEQLDVAGRKALLDVDARGLLLHLDGETLHLHPDPALRSGGVPADLLVVSLRPPAEGLCPTLRLRPGERVRLKPSAPASAALVRQAGVLRGRKIRLRWTAEGLKIRAKAPERPTLVERPRPALRDPRAARRETLRELAEIVGPALRGLDCGTAMSLLGEVVERGVGREFRPTDGDGGPGRLLELPDGVAPILVGDLHGRVENLLSVLAFGDHLRALDEGRAALVLLGDLVHPEEPPLDEMSASIRTMDVIFALMSRFGSRILALRGNHESFAADLRKRGVAQGGAWRRALEKERGRAYVARMRALYEAMPLVAVGSSWVASHAGPPRTRVRRRDLVRGDDPGLVEALTGSRLRVPGNPAGYSGRDVRRFRRSLGLPESAPVVVGHFRLSDDDTAWPDAGRIDGLHVLSSSAPDQLAAMRLCAGSMNLWRAPADTAAADILAALSPARGAPS